MNRRADFSAHPAHGKWASAREHFDEGETLSERQWLMLSKFVDGERVVGAGGDDRVVIDVLPPIVRPDSP